MKGCKGALVSFSLRFTPHDIYYLALHFAICSNLLMLFIYLISICSQGDPGYGYYPGAKGDKGLEGPDVRYYMPFIPFALTSEPPFLIVHMCIYENILCT